MKSIVGKIPYLEPAGNYNKVEMHEKAFSKIPYLEPAGNYNPVELYDHV